MSSILLDFNRSRKKSRHGSIEPTPTPTKHTEGNVPTATAPIAITPATEPTEVVAHKGPLDFPAIVHWLSACEDDFERGRDKHEYSRLAVVFAANSCTRIDDITRMSTDEIKSLAAEVGVIISVGLVNRVHQYATEDVARVKIAGRLLH